MPLFTAEQLDEVRAIIRRYSRALGISFFGAGADPKLIAQLRENGLLEADEDAPDLVSDTFAYGQLLARSGDLKLREAAPAEVIKRLRENPAPPLSEAEQAIVETARRHAGQYVTNLGDRMAADVMADISNLEGGFTPEQIRAIVADETAANRERRKGAANLKKRLGSDRVGTWERDWQRLATSEVNDAIQEGTAVSFEREHDDPLVSKLPRPDACPDCVRLYLTAGQGSVPRVFRLSELRANGTNVGRKRASWVPTVGNVHPWCGCQLVRLPPGMEWSAEDGSPEMVPKQVKKSLFSDIDDLIKAAHHNYLRRIPTGKVKPKYRYVYSIDSKWHGNTPAKGEKIRVSHQGQDGHYTIHETTKDGRVRAVHDETGDERLFHPEALHDLFHSEHREKIQAKHDDLVDTHRAAKRYGTAQMKRDAKERLDSFQKRFNIDPNESAIDRIPATVKGRWAAYQSILEAANIKDHDSSAADQRYLKARAEGTVRDLPALSWAGTDAFNEGTDRKKKITSVFHGFEHAMRTRGIKSWKDMGPIIEMLRDAPGFSRVRMPDDINARRAHDDRTQRRLEPEQAGSAVPDSYEPDDGDISFDFGANLHKSKPNGSPFKLHYQTTWQGLPISVENRKGSHREWEDDEGNTGRTKMQNAYGYIRGTHGADDDEIDCFLGPDDNASRVYIVHQRLRDGDKFYGHDEDKVMLGFSSSSEAKRAYLVHYDDPRYFGSMTEMPVTRFKKVLEKNKGAQLRLIKSFEAGEVTRLERGRVYVPPKPKKTPGKRPWLRKAGGPFIGPRGGKWADAAHTIPWKGDEAPKKSIFASPKDKKDFTDIVKEFGGHVLTLNATDFDVSPQRVRALVKKYGKDARILNGIRKIIAGKNKAFGRRIKGLEYHAPTYSEAAGYAQGRVGVAGGGGRNPAVVTVILDDEVKKAGTGIRDSLDIALMDTRRPTPRPQLVQGADDVPVKARPAHMTGIAEAAGYTPEGRRKQRVESDAEDARARRSARAGRFWSMRDVVGISSDAVGSSYESALEYFPEMLAAFREEAREGAADFGSWRRLNNEALAKKRQENSRVSDLTRKERMKRNAEDGIPAERPLIKGMRIPLSRLDVDLLPLDPLEDAEELRKGATHKYLARYPTGKKKPKYRYVYAVRGNKRSSSAEGVAVHRSGVGGDKLEVGASFRDAHKDHGGHWVVTGTEPITLKHDETGETKTFESTYKFRDWLHEIHAEAIDAEKTRRRAQSDRDARAAVKVLSSRFKALQDNPDPEALRKLGNQWKLVAQHAADADWGIDEWAAALGVDTSLPKTWAQLTNEFNALDDVLIDKGHRRQADNRHSAYTRAKGIASVGDLDLAKKTVRWLALERQINAMGEEKDAFQKHYFGERVSYSNRKPGNFHLDVPLTTIVEKLSKTRGEITDKKVLDAIKDKVKDWGHEDRKRTGSTLGKGVSISGQIAYDPSDKERALAKRIHEVAKAHGILSAPYVDAIEHGPEIDEFTEALKPVRDEAEKVSGTFARPELYADDFKPVESLDVLKLIGDEPKLDSWTAKDPERTARAKKNHAAVVEAIKKGGDPIVDFLVRSPSGKYVSTSAPLSTHLEVMLAPGAKRAAEHKAAHEKRWSEAKKGMDRVAKALEGANHSKTAWAAMEPLLSDIAADHGGEVLEAMRDGAKLRATVGFYERTAEGKKFRKQKNYAAGPSEIADSAAMAYMASAHPELHKKYETLSWSENKAGREEWRRKYDEVRSRLQDAGVKAVLDDIRERVGHSSDLEAARSRIVSLTPDEIRASYEELGARRQAKAKAGEQIDAKPYDLKNDPAKLNRLLGFVAADTAPSANLQVVAGHHRAHCSQQNAIRLAPTDGPGVVWHEFGHAIEHDNPGIRDAANALRDQRGRNTPRKTLNEIHGIDAYDDTEVSYEDEWENAYTGKWYGMSQSTEVLSMGVEEFMADPVKFAAQDPEHYHFVVAALTGQYGKRHEESAHDRHVKAIRQKVREAKTAKSD